jgi:hypothetical protein
VPVWRKAQTESEHYFITIPGRVVLDGIDTLKSATYSFASFALESVGQRSINSDDTAGVKAIYGVKSASKPQISGMTGAFSQGSVLTINGFNFSPTSNQVWFTKTNSDGVPIKVTGVSSTGGGTQIQVSIPAGAVDGDVMVRLNGTGHTSLSNAFPINIGGGVGGPFITALDPVFGAAGGWEATQVLGIGFTGATAVTMDGNNVSPSW